MAIQLQPQLSDLFRWEALAEQEGFYFEAAELLAFPAIAAPEKLPYMTELYRLCGRTRSIHGAFIDVNPASSDPKMAELSRRRCEESCRLALELGAENVVLHSGAFPFLRGPYLENWAAKTAEFYEELAERFPVNIYVENAQDLDPQPLRLLMDRISSRRIGVCLDAGHANYSRAPVEAWFEALEGRIGYMHLSDNMGLFDDHLPLGQGTIDWEKLNLLWRSLDRDIPVTLETGSLESTLLSLEFLRERKYFALGGKANG